MKRYEDTNGEFVGTKEEWLALGFDEDEFEAAFAAGHIEEVIETDFSNDDGPPF